MRRRNLSFLVLTSAVMLVSFITAAYAIDLKTQVGSINALGTGYAITRWPVSSGDIPLGSTVTVRAYTLNNPLTTDTKQVEFTWIEPDGTRHSTGKQDLAPSTDTWGLSPTWFAEDSFVIDVEGSWGVQAEFYYKDGSQAAHPLTEIRAISWHPSVIPEVPLGTLLVSVAMLGAFGIYYWKRKSNLAIGKQA